MVMGGEGCKGGVARLDVLVGRYIDEPWTRSQSNATLNGNGRRCRHQSNPNRTWCVTNPRNFIWRVTPSRSWNVIRPIPVSVKPARFQVKVPHQKPGFPCRQISQREPNSRYRVSHCFWSRTVHEKKNSSAYNPSTFRFRFDKEKKV